jgi:hypothetical protein
MADEYPFPFFRWLESPFQTVERSFNPVTADLRDQPLLPSATQRRNLIS